MGRIVPLTQPPLVVACECLVPDRCRQLQVLFHPLSAFSSGGGGGLGPTEEGTAAPQPPLALLRRLLKDGALLLGGDVRGLVELLDPVDIPAGAEHRVPKERVLGHRAWFIACASEQFVVVDELVGPLPVEDVWREGGRVGGGLEQRDLLDVFSLTKWPRPR